MKGRKGMIRFTNKDRTGIGLDVEEFDGKDNDVKGAFISMKMMSALWKLADFEDLEEELGIDLLTLFKAMNEGAWFKDPRYNHKGEIYFSEAELYKSPQGKEKYSLYETTRRFNFRLKDYGRTWALTKEELE
jgi:hypothetical protein